MRLRIRDMREDHDLTQKQVAAYLMCDQSLYASHIDLSALGSMGGGGNRGQNRQNGQGGMGGPGGMPDRELLQKAMTVLQQSGGAIDDEARAALLELGLTEEEMEQLTEMASGAADPAYAVTVAASLLVLGGATLLLWRTKKRY